jgi:hypothetical protein
MNNEFRISKFLEPNPKEIALLHAESLSRGQFEHTAQDQKTIDWLEKLSDDLGYLGHRYFVEGACSFIVPIDNDEPEVRYFSTYDTSFEGELVSYSRLTIGRLIGHSAVSALCLTFDKAFLLPTFHETHSSELLHIPAYAIDFIEQVD